MHFQPAQIQPVNGHSDHEPPLLLMRPIFEAVRRVEGWLEEDEADLLMAACGRARSTGTGMTPRSSKSAVTAGEARWRSQCNPIAQPPRASPRHRPP